MKATKSALLVGVGGQGAILTAKDFFKGFRHAERLPRLRPEVEPALSAGG